MANPYPSPDCGDAGRRRRRPRAPPRWSGWAASTIAFTIMVACVRPPSPSSTEGASRTSGPGDNGEGASFSPPSSSDKDRPEAAETVAGDVLVGCDLDTPFEGAGAAARGTLRIAVHRGVAPSASGAFLDMVKSRHFDHKYIFRSVKGFIVQWGIESPGGDRSSKRRFPKADVDPPPLSIGGEEDLLRSNARGALNFAGGNSATGQVYVNRSDNKHLDKEPGSLPFATLDEASMAIVDAVHSYSEGMGQVKAVKAGDDEVKRIFPQMSRIEKCWVEEGSGG